MSALELQNRTRQRIINLMHRVHNLKTRHVKNSTGNIVAFVGLTKSGKSTLINCRMGSALICKRHPDTDIPVIVNDVGSKGPQIGVEGESETEDPEKFGNLPGTDAEMWDFPGLGDNKGTDQEVLNAISYQMVLRGKSSVRFVVVASYNLINGDNAVPFFELLHNLNHMCPQIANSLCIIGSKADNTSLKGLLQKVSSDRFPNADPGRREMIHKSQQLITKVLINGSYIEFKIPKMDEYASEESYVLPDAQDVVECIKKLKGARMGDVPFLVSHEAKVDISEYYEICSNVLDQNITELCSALTKYMDSRGIGVIEGDAAVKLVIHRNGKKAVEGIMAKANDFESFFEAVKQVGLGPSSEFPEYLARFTFIQELRCLQKNSEGKRDLFSAIQSCLENGLAQYNDLISQCEAIIEKETREKEATTKKNNAEINVLSEQIKKVEIESKESVARAAAALAAAEATAARARDNAKKAAKAHKKAMAQCNDRMERMEEKYREESRRLEESKSSELERFLQLHKILNEKPNVPEPNEPVTQKPMASPFVSGPFVPGPIVSGPFIPVPSAPSSYVSGPVNLCNTDGILNKMVETPSIESNMVCTALQNVETIRTSGTPVEFVINVSRLPCESDLGTLTSSESNTNTSETSLKLPIESTATAPSAGSNCDNSFRVQTADSTKLET